MPKKALLFIFYAHTPYVRNEVPGHSVEELRFFDFLSSSCLPFLRMCTRLISEHIPFKCGLVLSPLLCEMLADPVLQDQYLLFLDRHIAFGKEEMVRAGSDSVRSAMIMERIASFTADREEFVEVYHKNILEKIVYLMESGYIELLATAATPCFFPLYQNMPEAIAAQIDVGLTAYREHFSVAPAGFWLPATGYNAGLEKLIKYYGFDYTVLESQSFLFAEQSPSKGVFAPALMENGLFCFGKDAPACREICSDVDGFYTNPIYCDIDTDAGFTHDKALLKNLFDVKTGRRQTGYCYRSRCGIYDKHKAQAQAELDARRFLEKRAETLESVLDSASAQQACSLSVIPLHVLGGTWIEGMNWLEHVFRNADLMGVETVLPAEYLKKFKQVQQITPFYASNLPSGYADELINSTNDWMLLAVQKATERMIDLATRFPDDPGLKERILNMAAKELLLAQSIDWPLLVDMDVSAAFAVQRCKEHIESFTTVYELLGSGVVSTDWLIKREKKYPLFPELHYSCFSKKQ